MISLEQTVVIPYSATEADEAFVCEEAVHSGVGFTALPHEASKRDNVVLSSHFSIFVHLIDTHKVRSVNQERRKLKCGSDALRPS